MTSSKNVFSTEDLIEDIQKHFANFDVGRFTPEQIKEVIEDRTDYNEEFNWIVGKLEERQRLAKEVEKILENSKKNVIQQVSIGDYQNALVINGFIEELKQKLGLNGEGDLR